MSLPDSLTIPTLSDCQFYHENLPSIRVVHRHASQAAQVSQHLNSTSPLPSPLHRLHHPQVGGQQSHTYTLRSNSQGSIEPHKFSFKHNQGGSLRSQNHSQGNFSPQQRFVPQGHNTTPCFRNQQQYNRNTWRRRKREDLPALNQSRWKTRKLPDVTTLSLGLPQPVMNLWVEKPWMIQEAYFDVVSGSQKCTKPHAGIPKLKRVLPMVLNGPSLLTLSDATGLFQVKADCKALTCGHFVTLVWW